MKLLKLMLIAFAGILVACGGDKKTTQIPVISLTPMSVSVKVGASQTFSAQVTGTSNSAVTWSVIQAGGGTISAAGVYTAPNVAGNYTVRATSVADTGVTASATVTVLPLDKAQVRVFHASPDAPAVNLWVNNAVAASKLDYQKSTGYLALDEGTYKIAVEGIIPGGNATVIGPVDLAFAGKTRYDVFAINSVAKIEPLILTDTGSLTDATKVRVKVAHLAAAAPEVKVYVTAPGADLAGASPLGSFVFKGTLGPVEIAPGNYQIRVTLANNTLVFDSGSIALAAGKDLLVAAVPNVGAGSSPINLAVLDAGTTGIIFDKSAGANLRVVHASADAPIVDVLANNGMTPAISKLEFPASTGYLNLAAATYNFKVVATGTLSPAVINQDVPLANGAEYSLLAVNSLSKIEPLLLTDNNRKVATEAKVRLIHASTLAGNVDIYVLPKGTAIGTNTPAFANVPFKANTGYVSLKAGDYDVIITPHNQPSNEAIKATLTFANGKIYTAVARDGTSLTVPLGVIGLDGLAP